MKYVVALNLTVASLKIQSECPKRSIYWTVAFYLNPARVQPHAAVCSVRSQTSG